MSPAWMHALALASLSFALFCAVVIALHELARPQHLWIMNVVWPVSAFYGGPVTLFGYFKYGSLATKRAVMKAKDEGKEPPNKTQTPFPVMVAKGATHCGSGCTLGDIAAEWLAFFIPTIAIWLGWQSLFSEKIFAVWILDYIFAFIFGIAFQYFTIVPMRNLRPLPGLWQAVKADTLSLTAWQAGMYGFMAFAIFYLFRQVFGTSLETNSVEFWFMMQIAMICGFITAYPVNWLLISKGVKEKM